MSKLYVIDNKSKIDSRETQKLLEKCFKIAAQRTGSMRGVLQGDMRAVVSASKSSKAA